MTKASKSTIQIENRLSLNPGRLLMTFLFLEDEILFRKWEAESWDHFSFLVGESVFISTSRDGRRAPNNSFSLCRKVSPSCIYKGGGFAHTVVDDREVLIAARPSSAHRLSYQLTPLSAESRNSTSRRRYRPNDHSTRPWFMDGHISQQHTQTHAQPR